MKNVGGGRGKSTNLFLVSEMDHQKKRKKAQYKATVGFFGGQALSEYYPKPFSSGEDRLETTCRTS